jgi:transposase
MTIQFSTETLKHLNKELELAEKLNNLRLFKIVQSLFMRHNGTSVPDIAELLRVPVRTVYEWIGRFLRERFNWLCGKHYQGRGRKCRLTKAQREDIVRMVDAGPEDAGFDMGVWTSAMIQEMIQRKFGVTYTCRYLCSLLKKWGLSYQKAKFVPDKVDEEKWQQQRTAWQEETWPEILRLAHELGAVILFEDEASYRQWGSLAYTWGRRGKQPTVKTCGKRKSLKMFGTIELQGGDFQYRECEGRYNGDTYRTFLDQLLGRYACPMILIEDGAPYHHRKDVKAFKETLKAGSRLFAYKLPPYSPDFNPIEKLWRNSKKQATHCKYFPTFEDLRTAVVKAFKNYLEDASNVVCVMKKLRTEAGLV